MKKKSDDKVDVERIMKQIRRKIEKEAKALYSDKDINELLSADPGDVLDVRSVRNDLPELLDSAGLDWNVDGSFESYVGPKDGIKGKFLRKIRRLYWPFARITQNSGFTLLQITKQGGINLKVANLLHNLIYEITLLRIENDHLKDGYQVLLHKIEQLEARGKQFEKMVIGRDGAKKRPAKT